jgi:predicted AAA+ superfamily ATPase
MAILQKPEKIYLNNPNLVSVLSVTEPDKGNLRETFFINQVQVSRTLHYPEKGDFIVDGKWIFEVGGKNKSDVQIKGLDQAFVVRDDVEFPVSFDTLPLWLFGFLY